MTLINLIAANPTADDAAILALCAPVVTSRPYYVSHRTALAVCGLAAAEWVAGALKAQAPTTYAVYTQVGATDGTAGGLDVSDPATQDFLGLLVQASAADTEHPGLFTADMRSALIALGQTTTYPTGQAETLTTVAAARAATAVAAAKAKVVSALASVLNDGLPGASDLSASAVLQLVTSALAAAGVA